MFMRAFRILMVVAVSMSLVLAGCGGKTKTEPSKVDSTVKTTAPDPTNTLIPTTPITKVNVPMSLGDQSLFIYLQPLLAEKLGYFEEEGITVEPKSFKGGSAIAQALATGEVKFASMGLDNVIRYGADTMVALAVYTRTPGMVFMVSPKHSDSIKTIQDLKGKKVGITSAGSGSHTVFMALLQANGLKATDVEFVPVGFAVDKAFEEDKIVAGYAYDPLASRMLDKNQGTLLIDIRSVEETNKVLGGEFTTSVLATSREIMQKEPELVQKVVRAIIKAQDFIITQDAAKVANVVPDQFKGGDASYYVQALNNSRAMFHPSGVMTTGLVESSVRWMKATNALPESEQIKFNNIFDTTFASKK